MATFLQRKLGYKRDFLPKEMAFFILFGLLFLPVPSSAESPVATNSYRTHSTPPMKLVPLKRELELLVQAGLATNTTNAPSTTTNKRPVVIYLPLPTNNTAPVVTIPTDDQLTPSLTTITPPASPQTSTQITNTKSSAPGVGFIAAAPSPPRALSQDQYLLKDSTNAVTPAVAADLPPPPPPEDPVLVEKNRLLLKKNLLQAEHPASALPKLTPYEQEILLEALSPRRTAVPTPVPPPTSSSTSSSAKPKYIKLRTADAEPSPEPATPPPSAPSLRLIPPSPPTLVPPTAPTPAPTPVSKTTPAFTVELAEAPSSPAPISPAVESALSTPSLESTAIEKSSPPENSPTVTAEPTLVPPPTPQDREQVLMSPLSSPLVEAMEQNAPAEPPPSAPLNPLMIELAPTRAQRPPPKTQPPSEEESVPLKIHTAPPTLVSVESSSTRQPAPKQPASVSSRSMVEKTFRRVTDEEARNAEAWIMHTLRPPAPVVPSPNE